MHRIICIVGGVGLAGCGAAALMAGCGSDDAAVIPDGADASEASSSSSSGAASGSSSGGSSTSSSGGTTDGGAPDALGPPTDGAAGGGDATPNPTKVTCGASECTTPTQVCCRTFNDAGCIAANDTCNGIKNGCDEKADCQGNEICCASFNTTTTCATSCGGGYQICKSGSECDGGTCKEWSCPANQKVRACEKPFVGCN